jgi:5'-AMP-activated protein kinase catalytic alpha subunit
LFQVAIKIIRKDEEKKPKSEDKKSGESHENSPLNNLSKEVKLLIRLDHPNVIKLHQVIDTDTDLYIVMEYVSGGELVDYIAAKGCLSEKESCRIFRQLISAIDHCHQAGVIHRDLKLENLLLTSDKNLKLSDYGLGRTVSGEDHYLNTFCGTPLYAGMLNSMRVFFNCKHLSL